MTATTNAEEILPRWDLDALYPGPDSPEIREAMQAIQEDAAGVRDALAKAESP